MDMKWCNFILSMFIYRSVYMYLLDIESRSFLNHWQNEFTSTISSIEQKTRVSNLRSLQNSDLSGAGMFRLPCRRNILTPALYWGHWTQLLLFFQYLLLSSSLLILSIHLHYPSLPRSKPRGNFGNIIQIRNITANTASLDPKH